LEKKSTTGRSVVVISVYLFREFIRLLLFKIFKYMPEIRYL